MARVIKMTSHNQLIPGKAAMVLPEQTSVTQIIVNFSTFSPLLHPKKFAELSGLSHDVINGWIRNDYLPTVKHGRYRMINIVALSNQLGA